MAPKRQKKQKAKQVRHHQEGKHAEALAGDEPLDVAAVAVDARRATNGTPSKAAAAPAVTPAPVAVEERPPALDIWPDFEEVVFPSSAADRRERSSTTDRPDTVDGSGDDQVAAGRDDVPETQTRPEPPRERRRAKRTPPSPTPLRESPAAVRDEDALRPNGAAPRTVVCSGMLTREADRVSDSFAATGLRETKRLTDGDWAALLLRRS